MLCLALLIDTQSVYGITRVLNKTLLTGEQRGSHER